MSGRARAFATGASMLLVACSFLTDTDGLTGGDGGATDGGDDAPGSANEGGATGEGGATTDAPIVDAGGNVDTGPGDGSAQCSDDAGCAGGPCAAGRCLIDPVVVASAGVKLFGLAVTDDAVYFAGNTRVYGRPLDGGAIVIVDDGGALGQMAQAGSYLYFPRSGNITRAARDGSGSALIHSQYDSPITAVATSGTSLLFTGPKPGYPGATSLFSMIPDAGVPSMTATDAFTFAEAVYATTSTVYVADHAANAIVTLAGGSPPATTLLNLSGAKGVFVDEPLMWVTSNVTETVYRTLADGTGPLEPIAVAQPNLSQVVVTKTDVYFLSDANVMRLPR